MLLICCCLIIVTAESPDNLACLPGYIQMSCPMGRWHCSILELVVVHVQLQPPGVAIAGTLGIMLLCRC